MSGGDKKPAFNFNPSNFKFDFNAQTPAGDHSSDDEDHGSNAGSSSRGGGMKMTPDIMAALQSKLGSMIGLGSGLFGTLPKAVQRRIRALEGLNDKYESLNEEFEREFYLLEKKYEALYQPLYARRTEIVTGKAEPTEEEVEAGRPEEEDGPKIEEVKEEKEGAVVVAEENIVGVPKFWLGALQSFDENLMQIEEADEPALEHLIDITCELFDQQLDKPAGEVKKEEDDEDFEDLFSGFKLTFHFSPNDYFTNTTITKTIFLLDGNFDHSECDKIEWKAGKNLTVRTVSKQIGGGRGGKRGRGGRGGRGGGGGGATKTIQVEEPTNSFFGFFSSQSADEDDEEEEVDEEEQDKVQRYYEIAETIRNEILPRAVMWYLGEGHEPDYEDMMSEEMMRAMSGGGGDGDSDDEDGDFDPSQVKPGQQAPECKQQ